MYSKSIGHAPSYKMEVHSSFLSRPIFSFLATVYSSTYFIYLPSSSSFFISHIPVRQSSPSYSISIVHPNRLLIYRGSWSLGTVDSLIIAESLPRLRHAFGLLFQILACLCTCMLTQCFVELIISDHTLVLAALLLTTQHGVITSCEASCGLLALDLRHIAFSSPAQPVKDISCPPCLG